MESSHNTLSLGRLVRDHGCTFTWRTEQWPLLTLPSGRRLLLTIVRYVPYICQVFLYICRTLSVNLSDIVRTFVGHFPYICQTIPVHLSDILRAFVGHLGSNWSQFGIKLGPFWGKDLKRFQRHLVALSPRPLKLEFGRPMPCQTQASNFLRNKFVARLMITFFSTFRIT